MSAAASLYERVGGTDYFVRLVDRFYDGVAEDPLLRAMYPEDLQGPRQRLALFLAQYFGGPEDYNALRGQPRLRMRHFAFPIDAAAKDAWLVHMGAALELSRAAGEISGEDAVLLGDYLTSTANFLLNRGGLSIVGK